jgi:hypothetical protein
MASVRLPGFTQRGICVIWQDQSVYGVPVAVGPDRPSSVRVQGQFHSRCTKAVLRSPIG